MKCSFCEREQKSWLVYQCSHCGARNPVELSPYRAALYLVPVFVYIGGVNGYALGETLSGFALAVFGAILGGSAGAVVGLYVGLAIAPGVFKLAQWFGRSWSSRK